MSKPTEYQVGDYIKVAGIHNGTARVFATSVNKNCLYVGYNMGSAEYAAAVRGSMPNKYEVLPMDKVLCITTEKGAAHQKQQTKKDLEVLDKVNGESQA